MTMHPFSWLIPARLLASVALVALAALLVIADEDAKKAPAYPFVFTDVGDKAGLFPHLGKIRGHGAAWGDVAGDGWLDLYVATFANQGSKANLFFRNKKGTFEPDEQKALAIPTRGTGVV